jgi:hypothetical protein
MTDSPTTNPPLGPLGNDRLTYWRRRLGRIRLGAEPVEEQLARYLRVNWMLTAVLGIVATMFVALFTAFRRPDIGLVLAGVLFLPVAALAWLDHALLRWRVGRYLREVRAHSPRSNGPTPDAG